MPFKPYYAVIFSSTLTDDTEGYHEMSERMISLAKKQPGFMGVESARSEIGITISYWESKEAISAWKKNAEHLQAQKWGREKWYKSFNVRIALIEREYAMK